MPTAVCHNTLHSSAICSRHALCLRLNIRRSFITYHDLLRRTFTAFTLFPHNKPNPTHYLNCCLLGYVRLRVFGVLTNRITQLPSLLHCNRCRIHNYFKRNSVTVTKRRSSGLFVPHSASTRLSHSAAPPVIHGTGLLQLLRSFAEPSLFIPYGFTAAPTSLNLVQKASLFSLCVY